MIVNPAQLLQGQEAALTVITQEAFEKLKKGSASIENAAAMQVKLTYCAEKLEDSTNLVGGHMFARVCVPCARVPRTLGVCGVCCVMMRLCFLC